MQAILGEKRDSLGDLEKSTIKLTAAPEELTDLQQNVVRVLSISFQFDEKYCPKIKLLYRIR